MADEPKTDGVAGAEKTATQTPGAKTAAATGGDKPDTVPYDRFQGVVAERERWKEKAETLEKTQTQEAEKHKTESQKQIDAAVQKIVDVEWKPKGDRLGALESMLKTDVEDLLAKIPEQHRAAVDQSAPIEVQLRQARALTAAFEASAGKTPPKINGGANPPSNAEPKSYTRAQWDEFTELGKTSPAEFDKIKLEMYAAAREGRVAGLRGGVGPK